MNVNQNNQKDKKKAQEITAQKESHFAELSKKFPLASKITLSKIKQKAEGNSGIPMESRIYFEVHFPRSSNKPTKFVFFDKKWKVGKVLDVVAEKGGIVNENHKPKTNKLRLFSLTSQNELQNSMTLEELEKSKVIASGDSILLERDEFLS
eukprot:TRINITY_DN968_c0_g1_i1.p2 TRINITY_DN968_c0_g1~~TRINITY_DN968_c0_g1_i1.p2  ORF type:complete len:151 (-),score=47.66 TRINITY_DN968_c0_g1_i1:112-564(-)